MRYYYKNGNNYLNLKSPASNPKYEEITEQEFIAATTPKQPTKQEAAVIAKMNRIGELKQLLRNLDYIGVKIATGRATREEYSAEIALMNEYAVEINQLNSEIEGN